MYYYLLSWIEKKKAVLNEQPFAVNYLLNLLFASCCI